MYSVVNEFKSFLMWLSISPVPPPHATFITSSHHIWLQPNYLIHFTYIHCIIKSSISNSSFACWHLYLSKDL